MNHVLSSIQVVDSDQVCLHEDHEPNRLDDTCQSISQQGMLLHPPIARRMQDGRYLILDGAHRTAALQKIGCRRIPVQVVTDADYQLEAWAHLVPFGPWLNGLLQHDAFLWKEEQQVEQAHIATIVYADGSKNYVSASEDGAGSTHRLRLWQQIVQSYSSSYPVRRIPHGMNVLPEADMVCLRYRPYTMEEIETIVTQGHVMPAGVTRFLISGRLLNLKIPLSLLLDPRFDEQEWEAYRQHWASSLRLYAETVYLNEKEFMKVPQQI
ncbi:ParB N-terminal domain-containing protein [Brevibacillus agri]|uniref:ParB N-terminal domain-containing protein n=1 Tax=Brevibacillus agri TaxID=51101 RepID=UPI0024BF49BA|nr:ParB N-terminal domain-containing protein [Brevibacillus agri]WHX28272.1 ParB N-terminal domain-containing protein [Brevibacillus agri]